MRPEALGNGDTIDIDIGDFVAPFSEDIILVWLSLQRWYSDGHEYGRRRKAAGEKLKTFRSARPASLRIFTSKYIGVSPFHVLYRQTHGHPPYPIGDQEDPRLTIT